MSDAEEPAIYRDLIRFKPEELTPNAWAVRAGVSRTVWADMRRHGNPSRRVLEKLLLAAGSSLAEFEALRIGDERRGQHDSNESGVRDLRSWSWSEAALPPLPLLATSLAAEEGSFESGIELTEIRNEVLDRLPRPQSLAHDRDAYALTIVRASMWPRFRPGRRVAVSPRSPVAIGDDVVVRLQKAGVDGESDTALVLISELVNHTANSLELRQFNPDRTFQVDPADVASLHKIEGELI